MQNIIYLLLTVLIFHNIALAETYSHNLPTKIKNFIEYLELQKPKLQGGAIAIISKGEAVYKTTFGHKQGNEGAITYHTLFPLASVSKIVSSTAIALMVDKKQIDLDKEYLFPYLKSKVTLKNILGNSTGYRINGNQDIEKGMSRKDLLDKLSTLPQSCIPGKCYFYSNLCFSLVDDVLKKEKLSLGYAIDMLKKTIKTDEIELSTLPEGADVAFPHIKNKKRSGFTQLPFPKYYPKAVPGAAGVFASLEAMIELFKLEFFYRPDLISREILEIFYEPYLKANVDHWKLSFPVDSYYALGWRVFKSPNNKSKNLIFHGGTIAGINSFVGFIPSEEIGIIILLNQASPAAAKIGLDFWREFLEQ